MDNLRCSIQYGGVSAVIYGDKRDGRTAIHYSRRVYPRHVRVAARATADVSCVSTTFLALCMPYCTLDTNLYVQPPHLARARRGHRRDTLR